MRKIVFILLALFLLSQPIVSRAGEEFTDQSSTSGTGSLKICTGSIMYQTFTPTINRIHKIEIEVSNASGQIRSGIKTLTGAGWEDAAYPETVNAVNGWNTFDFIDFPVVPGNTYAISVFADCSSNAQWKYGAGNPYNRGLMIFQSNEKPDWDFNFKVIGQIDQSLITPTVTVTAGPGGETPVTTDDSNNPSSEKTAGVTSETLGEVSSAIAKPTDLIAKFVLRDNFVVLTWKASTTKDIDGYKIFRSDKKDTGFLKAGEVTKDKLEFTDKSPTSGKTLYYQVRAYKTNKQSVSSNTASIDVPAFVVKSPVALKSTTAEPESFIDKYWPYLVLLLVAISGAAILIVRKYKLTKKKPDQATINKVP